MEGKHPLPDAVAGHWTTPGGREMAAEYAAKSRDEIGSRQQTDFELANALYLESGPIGLQTVAKQRMRWLSVQLFLAEQAKAELVGALKEARDLLMERIQGSHARSPAHNARLVIDAAIAKATGEQSQ